MAIARNVPLLAWHNLCVDFRLYNAVAVLWFAEVAGSFALGLSVFSVTMIVAAVAEVPTGVVSDRVGRRRTLLLGSIAEVGAVVLYAAGAGYPGLLAGAVLEGVARALYSGNNAALLVETLEETGRRDAYAEYSGKLSALFQVASGLSAILGGVVAVWSLAATFWLSVVPALAAVGISLAIVEPARARIQVNPFRHLAAAMRQFAANPRLRLLSLGTMIEYGAGETGYQFQPAFIATLWPVWAIGIARAVSGATAALSFYSSGAVLRRVGVLRTLVIGRIASSVATIGATLAASVFSPLVFAGASIFFGVTSVAKGTLLQAEFSADQRATMGSITALGASITFGLFAIVIGAVADSLGAATALLICQVVAAPVVVLYLFLGRRKT